MAFMSNAKWMFNGITLDFQQAASIPREFLRSLPFCAECLLKSPAEILARLEKTGQQAFSCVRDWPLSASWGTIMSTISTGSKKLFRDHYLFLLKIEVSC